MKKTENDFLDILSNYQGILYKISLIYFRNEHDRKDNFQEIVYQMWKGYPKLKKKKSIASWIYSVAINTSISRLKLKSKIDFRETVPEPDLYENINKQMDCDEDLQLLLQAIYSLNDIDKSIILLYLEEKTYDEIAEIIAISQSNVGTRINRAKKILKQKLKIIER